MYVEMAWTSILQLRVVYTKTCNARVWNWHNNWIVLLVMLIFLYYRERSWSRGCLESMKSNPDKGHWWKGYPVINASVLHINKSLTQFNKQSLFQQGLLTGEKTKLFFIMFRKVTSYSDFICYTFRACVLNNLLAKVKISQVI